MTAILTALFVACLTVAAIYAIAVTVVEMLREEQ